MANFHIDPFAMDNSRNIVNTIEKMVAQEVSLQVAEVLAKSSQTTQPVSELRERCVMAVLRQTCTSYEINSEATIKAADSLAQYILNGVEKE